MDIPVSITVDSPDITEGGPIPARYTCDGQDVSPPPRWSREETVRARPLSAGGVTLDGVEVSAEAVAKVPGDNLRVSRAAFGALWALAEHLGSQPPGPDSEYLIGVLWTCRWLADQPVWSRVAGRAEMPAAPLTQRRHAAMPETIDEEYLAAVTARPFERDRGRGVAATLEWTWHGSGRPPLDISHAAAS